MPPPYTPHTQTQGSPPHTMPKLAQAKRDPLAIPKFLQDKHRPPPKPLTDGEQRYIRAINSGRISGADIVMPKVDWSLYKPKKKTKAQMQSLKALGYTTYYANRLKLDDVADIIENKIPPPRKYKRKSNWTEKENGQRKKRRRRHSKLAMRQFSPKPQKRADGANLGSHGPKKPKLKQVQRVVAKRKLKKIKRRN